MARALPCLALLWLSCGTSPPRCADVCAGCCDAKDVCKPGNTHGLCGLGGGVCLACPKSDVCTDGACMTPPCGPDTCTGCCDVGSNQCVVSAADNACGLGGTACVICGSSRRCDNGTCINCLASGATCTTSTSCCSQQCDGATQFAPGACH